MSGSKSRHREDDAILETHLRRKEIGQGKREGVRLERVLKAMFRAMGKLWHDFNQVLIMSRLVVEQLL